MTTEEALFIITGAAYSLLTPLFTKIWKKAEREDHPPWDGLLHEAGGEVDRYIYRAEEVVGDRKAMKELIQQADPSVIACVGLRFAALSAYLYTCDPQGSCRFPMFSADRPLVSALIDCYHYYVSEQFALRVSD